jgi:hypothetical protein
MAQIPPSLRPLLGQHLGELNETTLSRIIGVEEGQFIEFKRELSGGQDNHKATNHELALDVTAFANASGGLLLYGVEEDGATGEAMSIVGLNPAGEDIALRIEQVVGSKVQPSLNMTVEKIDYKGRYVVAVAVDASPLSPHAVADGTKKLSYPVRRGRSKVYLTEAEVADAYSRRFTSADKRSERLLRDHADHTATLRTLRKGWIAVSLLPSGLGLGSVRPGIVAEYQELVGNKSAWQRVRHKDGKGWQAKVGYRGVELADTFGDSISQHAQLTVDGAGCAAIGFPVRAEVDGSPLHPQRLELGVAGVVETVLDILDLLTRHAAFCGAHGEAEVAINVHTIDRVATQIVPGVGFIFTDDWPFHPGPVPVSSRVLSLDAMIGDARHLLQGAYILSIDLASRFGLSDLLVLSSDGVVTEAAERLASGMADWAQRNGL